MNGPGGLFTSTNTMSSGMLGILLLFFVFLIGYVASKRLNLDEERAFVSGLFTAGFFGALFYFTGILSWDIAFIPIILLLIMSIFKAFNRRD
jgi:FtsH-binding integral membrane protein